MLNRQNRRDDPASYGFRDLDTDLIGTTTLPIAGLSKEGNVGQREEQIVRAYIDAGIEGDIDKVLSYFANDCEWWTNQRNEPLRGLDAIRAEWEQEQDSFTNLPCEFLNMASTDRVVFSERIDTAHLTHLDRDVRVHIVNVFELDPQGKIWRKRDYFDMKEIEAQIGGA
jgi:limonene-1,2-epoxide hydrolase